MHTQNFSTRARHLSHAGETFVRRQSVLAHGHQLAGETAAVPLEVPIEAEAEEVEEHSSRSRPGQPYLRLTP